jgi:hypothetical protein
VLDSTPGVGGMFPVPTAQSVLFLVGAVAARNRREFE